MNDPHARLTQLQWLGVHREASPLDDPEERKLRDLRNPLDGDRRQVTVSICPGGRTVGEQSVLTEGFTGTAE